MSDEPEVDLPDNPDPIEYSPSEYGKRFHLLRTDEALGGGAAGVGKSLILVADIFEQLAHEHERCEMKKIRWGNSRGRALHLRRQSTELSETITRAQRIFRAVDPKVDYIGKELTFVFSSGYRFQMGHCNLKDDWRKYYSNEYSHIALDEGWEFEEEQYERIRTRCRSGDPELMKLRKVRVMSNPHGGWIRKYFVDPNPPWEPRKIIKRKVVFSLGGKSYTDYTTRIFLPATLADNPDRDFAFEYARSLAREKPHIREALLESNWYFSVGAYYAEEWVKTKVEIAPFEPPYGCYHFRSMDWGFQTHGVVGWYFVMPGGRIVKHKEFTFKKMHVEQVAQRIKDIEVSLGLWDLEKGCSSITGPADTQLWEERGESGPSKAQTMERLGVHWVKANKKSKQQNAERLAMHLMAGRFCVFTNCKKTIETVPSIEADPNDPSVPKDGGDDHWLDETLYAVAFLPEDLRGLVGHLSMLNPGEQEEELKDRQREEQEAKENANRRGSYGNHGFGSW